MSDHERNTEQHSIEKAFDESGRKCHGKWDVSPPRLEVAANHLAGFERQHFIGEQTHENRLHGPQYGNRSMGASSMVQRQPGKTYTRISTTTASAAQPQLISRTSARNSCQWECRHPP